MAFNPLEFKKNNVLDSCSVTNVLSSSKFYDATKIAKCNFVLSAYVLYECLVKQKKIFTKEYQELQNRLTKCIDKQEIHKIDFYINDLIDFDTNALRDRRSKRLGKGEISAIVLAKKLNLSFLTDDQPARKFAYKVLGEGFVQTTPYLFGYLFFESILIDSDKEQIINDYKMFNPNGCLEKHLGDAYMLALEYRAKNNIKKDY